MAITWTQLQQTTPSGGGFDVTITTKYGAIASGWLLAVDIITLYDLVPGGSKEPISIGCKTAITHCTDAAPSSFTWVLQSTDTVTVGDYVQTIQTFSGIPLDPFNSPIGTGVAYMRLSSGTFTGSPNPGYDVDLTWRV
jgi:hypothetical protein